MEAPQYHTYLIQDPKFKAMIRAARRALKGAGLALTLTEAAEFGARGIDGAGADFAAHVALLKASVGSLEEWGEEIEALGARGLQMTFDRALRVLKHKPRVIDEDDIGIGSIRYEVDTARWVIYRDVAGVLGAQEVEYAEDSLGDWIAAGEYTGNETAESIAAEWMA